MVAEITKPLEYADRFAVQQADQAIVIATKALSVAPYLDEHGNGGDTPQGQVLLAELVTEAVCSEIARRGVANGIFLAPMGGEADAIRREQINLQNKYAHKIHECFVAVEYRRNCDIVAPRKGRLSKSEQLAKAVIPG